ncbi:CCR4-NOT transcription complex subunit 10, partial [Pichia californica]
MSETTKDGDVHKKRRRPHTRASKACEFCRQQKTRCLRSDSSIACLRCLSLNLKCSLLQESDLTKDLSKVITSPLNTSFIQSTSNNQSIPLLTQPKSVMSFLTSKSTSPQFQPIQSQSQSQSQQQSQSQSQPQSQSQIQNNNFDFSPQLLPSINSPISNILYDRSHTPNTQITRYPKNVENSQQIISPHISNNMSPRLSQSFISGSPLPNFSPNAVENKLDIIYNDVKQILDSIGTNSNNNSTISVNSKNLNYAVENMPIMNEPFNTTNIAIQHHLLSPINCLKLISEQENIKIINNNINNDNNNNNNNN